MFVIVLFCYIIFVEDAFLVTIYYFILTFIMPKFEFIAKFKFSRNQISSLPIIKLLRRVNLGRGLMNIGTSFRAQPSLAQLYGNLTTVHSRGGNFS